MPPDPTWPGRPALRRAGVCLDCADADELARFFGRLLGWEISARDGAGWIQIRDPAGGVGLNFQAERWYRPPLWPERPDGQDKMLHFAIEVDDVEAAVAHVAAGARVAHYQHPDRSPLQLRVMLDAAGHSFCLDTDAHPIPSQQPR